MYRSQDERSVRISEQKSNLWKLSSSLVFWLYLLAQNSDFDMLHMVEKKTRRAKTFMFWRSSDFRILMVKNSPKSTASAQWHESIACNFLIMIIWIFITGKKIIKCTRLRLNQFFYPLFRFSKPELYFLGDIIMKTISKNKFQYYKESYEKTKPDWGKDWNRQANVLRSLTPCL